MNKPTYICYTKNLISTFMIGNQDAELQASELTRLHDIKEYFEFNEDSYPIEIEQAINMLNTNTFLVIESLPVLGTDLLTICYWIDMIKKKKSAIVIENTTYHTSSAFDMLTLRLMAIAIEADCEKWIEDNKDKDND